MYWSCIRMPPVPTCPESMAPGSFHLYPGLKVTGRALLHPVLNELAGANPGSKCRKATRDKVNYIQTLDPGHIFSEPSMPN